MPRERPVGGQGAVPPLCRRSASSRCGDRPDTAIATLRGLRADPQPRKESTCRPGGCYPRSSAGAIAGRVSTDRSASRAPRGRPPTCSTGHLRTRSTKPSPSDPVAESTHPATWRVMRAATPARSHAAWIGLVDANSSPGSGHEGGTGPGATQRPLGPAQQPRPLRTQRRADGGSSQGPNERFLPKSHMGVRQPEPGRKDPGGLLHALRPERLHQRMTLGRPHRKVRALRGKVGRTNHEQTTRVGAVPRLTTRRRKPFVQHFGFVQPRVASTRPSAELGVRGHRPVVTNDRIRAPDFFAVRDHSSPSRRSNQGGLPTSHARRATKVAVASFYGHGTQRER